MQIIITAIIILFVIYIIYKNIKKISSATCSYDGTCSAKCPKIKDNNCSNLKFKK